MDDGIERIRSTNRENIEKERKMVREASINNRRRELATFDNSTYHESDVSFFMNGLSANSFSEAMTLTKLKNVIIQNEDNISAFFQVRGGLHALVGQFTGSDATRQLLAGECLCNIALGPTKTCQAVAKSAGVYLITYLDSGNPKLVEVCAWTLGNLAASDVKVAAILKAQGFIEKTVPLLDFNNHEDVIDAAAYALGHFLPANDHLVDHPQKEDMIKHIAFHRALSNYTLKLLFVFSSDPALIPLLASIKMFSKVVTQLVNTVNKSNWDSDKVSVDCLVKIAANLSCEEGVLDSEIGPLLDEGFKNAVVHLLISPYAELKTETCWLFGNILNSNASDSGWKEVFHSYIVHAQQFIFK